VLQLVSRENMILQVGGLQDADKMNQNNWGM